MSDDEDEDFGRFPAVWDGNSDKKGKIVRHALITCLYEHQYGGVPLAGPNPKGRPPPAGSVPDIIDMLEDYSNKAQDPSPINLGKPNYRTAWRDLKLYHLPQGGYPSQRALQIKAWEKAKITAREWVHNKVEEDWRSSLLEVLGLSGDDSSGEDEEDTNEGHGELEKEERDQPSSSALKKGKQVESNLFDVDSDLSELDEDTETAREARSDTEGVSSTGEEESEVDEDEDYTEGSSRKTSSAGTKSRLPYHPPDKFHRPPSPTIHPSFLNLPQEFRLTVLSLLI
ncbi:hypothetical protein T439DRAFT_115483 [Meredithblackwellia eburnea MCA 4105]